MHPLYKLNSRRYFIATGAMTQITISWWQENNSSESMVRKERSQERLTVLIGVGTVHHDVWLWGGCGGTLWHECSDCFFLQGRIRSAIMLILCYKENTFDTFRVKKKEKENVNFTHYAEVPQLLLTLSIILLGGKCSCLYVMHRVTVQRSIRATLREKNY